ncbi:hypothetical protein [Ruegeria sp. HKCCA0370]|nr:hypothetical protein [Ruegeria sp. HKCCA0370]
MAEIENPWHSRPIDVHRWSDHPEVAELIDRIWHDLQHGMDFESSLGLRD